MSENPAAPRVDLAQIPALQLRSLDESGGPLVSKKITDPAERQEVEQIARGVNLRDTAGVLGFGNKVQNEFNGVVVTQIGNVRLKDAGEAGKLLAEFRDAARGLKIDSLTDQEGFGLEDIPIVGPLFDKLKAFLRQNAKLAPVIEELIAKLHTTRVTSMNEITQLDQIHGENDKYFRKLEVWIAGGEEALQLLRAEFDKIKAAALASGDPAEAQKVRDLYEQLQMLDRKVFNLKMARGLALMNGPAIRTTQQHAKSVVEMCDNMLQFAVPQWWLQVRLAVAHYRNRLGIELEKKAYEFTNELAARNAGLLGLNEAQIKEAQGRGFVGIDTLKQMNTALIQVLDDGIQKDQQNVVSRRQQLEDLQRMEQDLKQAQLRAGSAVAAA